MPAAAVRTARNHARHRAPTGHARFGACNSRTPFRSPHDGLAETEYRAQPEAGGVDYVRPLRSRRLAWPNAVVPIQYFARRPEAPAIRWLWNSAVFRQMPQAEAAVGYGVSTTMSLPAMVCVRKGSVGSSQAPRFSARVASAAIS